MKRAIILLLAMFALCSCNTGKLEWWEAVNTSPERLEKASGRNDNNKMEKYLFEKADALEEAVKPYRTEPWTKSDNGFLSTLGFVYFLLTIGLLIFGFIVKFADIDSSWPRILLGILTVLVALIGVPYFLTTEVNTKGNTLDIGAILIIIDMILCVPFVIKDDENYYARMAPVEIGTYAFSTVLPVAMVLGAFSRVITTYASYLFILLIIIYAVSVIVTSIIYKESIFQALLTVLYLLIVGFGTVVILYSTMPAMVHIFNSIVTIIIAALVLSGYSSGSSRSSSTIKLDDGTTLTREVGLTGEEILTDSAGQSFERNSDGSFSKK